VWRSKRIKIKRTGPDLGQKRRCEEMQEAAEPWALLDALFLSNY
jgi:hypothetical protein